MSAYIIRTAFYIVLVVGLVDYIISFLRVEGLLKILLTDKFALNLGISSFRGTYIHLPIIVICSIISLFVKENKENEILIEETDIKIYNLQSELNKTKEDTIQIRERKASSGATIEGLKKRNQKR